MAVLTIQSTVVRGHVGNRAAVFVLERLGLAAWPIDTVRLSNHPAHGAWRGRAADPAEIAELVEGLAAAGALGGVDAVLTGYLGDAAQGPAAAAAARRVKAANPAALWALDPVIGDRGRAFVRPGIAEFLRDVAAPAADLLFPNRFELEFLTGRSAGTTEAALAAARALRAGGNRLVVVTGLVLADRPAGTLTTLAVGADAAWRVEAPALDHPAHGAGDAFAALFVALRLQGRAVPAALAHAASALHAVVARTAATPGALDLALVAGQDDLVVPPRAFGAIPVG